MLFRFEGHLAPAFIARKLGFSETFTQPQTKVKCRAQKKDKDRRKGKGRLFCLGGRNYSIPCRNSCFVQEDLKNRMNNPFLSNHPGAIDPIKSSSAKPLAWQGIEEILPPQIVATTVPLPFLLNLSFFLQCRVLIFLPRPCFRLPPCESIYQFSRIHIQTLQSYLFES